MIALSCFRRLACKNMPNTVNIYSKWNFKKLLIWGNTVYSYMQLSIFLHSVKNGIDNIKL